MTQGPIRFVFGSHLHQPVGNFDHVFEQHVHDVYQPFLSRVSERGFFPICLHISGPLLEWMEARAGAFLDQVGRLATDNKLELLLAGLYEPVLISIPRADRVEQIQWMREAIQRRFGIAAQGLWLTERVWEPELAEDLATAGVKYALVDDRHFLVTGFRSDQLHAPFWTESNGRRVALFPIDEHLRYLIPFRPPAETVAYLRKLRGDGHQLAVLADDGEKFGGWPGTKEWVYDRGWLAQFMDAVESAVQAGEVRLATLAESFAEVPSAGLAYLPTASYREMEAWSLTPPAATRLLKLEKDLGADRMKGPDGALVRGGHWRNFQVRYPESNRMHKKMQALSRWCRQVGDPPVARRAIGRAQCNDAYWHGVFGGLYLPHLRHAIWRQLALAERELRRDAPIAHETGDFDCDGHDEIWVHSRDFSAMLSPSRGASLEELTLFEPALNFADVLTRRREPYHEISRETELQGSSTGGTPSIHDIGGRLRELPPVDRDARALFVDRVLPGDLSMAEYACGDYPVIRSWARQAFHVEAVTASDVLELICRPRQDGGLVEKKFRLNSGGRVKVTYRWDPNAFPDGSLFAPELSVAHAVNLKAMPDTEVWSFPIKTVSKSERGFDETVQGESLTPRWAAALGQASIEIG